MKRILIYYIKSFFWFLIDKVLILLPTNYGIDLQNKEYSIGIVTYVDRYKRFFKPLIKALSRSFPDTEIVVAINGYYDITVQEKFLAEINTFLSKFKNVKIIEFKDPQSLSKLWNLLIINSKSEKIIVCNDDIKIYGKFRESIEDSGLLNEKIGLINRSWSHFLITKKIVKQVGWFDERFPGVGNEDEDYECRLVSNNINIKSYRILGLKNVVFPTSNFSYGKDTETVNVKYVRENKIFFDKKWKFSEDKKDGFVFVEILRGYVMLKDGMKTPDFY